MSAKFNERTRERKKRSNRWVNVKKRENKNGDKEGRAGKKIKEIGKHD